MSESNPTHPNCSSGLLYAPQKYFKASRLNINHQLNVQPETDDRVGHLNNILAQGRGNLNDTIQVQMPWIVSS